MTLTPDILIVLLQKLDRPCSSGCEYYSMYDFIFLMLGTFFWFQRDTPMITFMKDLHEKQIKTSEILLFVLFIKIKVVFLQREVFTKPYPIPVKETMKN